MDKGIRTFKSGIRELVNLRQILSFPSFIKYLSKVLAKFPSIFIDRSLAPADKCFGGIHEFQFPTGHSIRLKGALVGGVREIVGRRVYDGPLGFDQKEGQVVVDVGANQGIFGLYAAAHGARVLAIEAQKGLIRELKDNVARNGFVERVTPVWAIVGGETGRFSDLGEYRNASHSEGDPPERTMGQILEKFDIESVDFLKVDIEGSEFALFAENDTTWLDSVARLAMEVHPAHGEEDLLIEFLRAVGFVVHLSDRDAPDPSSSGTFILHGWREELISGEAT